MRRDVHRKAGVAEGKYRESLYSVAGFGPEMEISKQMHKEDLASLESTLTELGSSLEFIEHIRHRAESSAELERGMENLGKEKWEKEREKIKKKYAHDPSGTGYDPDLKWEDLDIREKSKYMPIQTYGKGSIWEKAAVLQGTKDPLYEFEGKEYSKTGLQTFIAGRGYDTLWGENLKNYSDKDE